MSVEVATNKTSQELTRDTWMIKPCKTYKQEYKDCRRLRGRIFQYFVYGDMLNCNQWIQDFNSCEKWVLNLHNLSAADDIIASEKARRTERLSAHENNTVWKIRSEPPENWNAPLPDYITRDYEKSYLQQQAAEMELKAMESANSTRKCSIM